MTDSARGTHDLNGVTRVKILGWGGRYVAQPSPEPGITIVSPYRDPDAPDEFWTFDKSAVFSTGQLTAFVDRAREGEAEGLMVIYIPADRMETLRIDITA